MAGKKHNPCGCGAAPGQACTCAVEGREKNYADFFTKNLHSLRSMVWNGDKYSAKDFADAEKWAKEKGYTFEASEPEWDLSSRQEVWYVTIKKPPTKKFPEGQGIDSMKLAGRPSKSVKRMASTALALEHKRPMENPSKRISRLLNPF